MTQFQLPATVLPLAAAMTRQFTATCGTCNNGNIHTMQGYTSSCTNPSCPSHGKPK